MSKKLRMAIIGCGGIACGAHASNYDNIDDIEIVAVCDIRPERMELIKSKYKSCADAWTTEDYMDIVNCPDIEAVDICTPNYLHAPIAIAALNAGKHVLTEKPDAMTVAEVEAMKEASEKNGKVLMAMRNNRFTPAAIYARKAIANDEYGRFYAGRCGWIRRRGVPGDGSWFADKSKSGGGPLIDLGVHMIDLAIFLMGSPKPVSVSGSTFREIAGKNEKGGLFDVEDLAMGFIKFDNGACLQIDFSWATNIEKDVRFVELRGTKAGIRIENDELSVFGEKYGVQYDEKPRPRGEYGHCVAIRHFADVVLNGTDPVFVPQQGVDMIKILNAIYESAETGKEVLL
ncbi:MAG: Gfo/Idh/MocA family oxidoreductase [Clostridia bacterium]|nr:Gfo/Idh/MocA family oxidoreductase [Clostridia bacterium]